MERLSSVMTVAASEFSRFSMLPLELQRGIWQAALQDEPVGLCIIFSTDTCRAPPRADIDMHVLMHVCHESRTMAISHFRYTMRQDRSGTFLGALRGFRADLDVLYIPTDRYDGFFDWRFLDGWPEQAQPHHVAIDGHEAQLSRGGVGLQVAALVASGRLPNLRSVSLIFAPDPAPVPVYDGKRCYKLVDLDQSHVVWCALPGGCKYEDTDPQLIAEWWKDSVKKAAGDRQMNAFQVIPRKIVMRKYPDVTSKTWLSTTLGAVTSRLHQLLV